MSIRKQLNALQVMIREKLIYKAINEYGATIDEVAELFQMPRSTVHKIFSVQEKVEKVIKDNK